MGSDNEDSRRSNPVGRIKSGANGAPMQAFPNPAGPPPGSSQGSKGKPLTPVRPQRDEHGASSLAEVRNGAVSEAEGMDRERERVMSPAEQMNMSRSKSPTQGIATRAKSPTQNGMSSPPPSSQGPPPGMMAAVTRSTSPIPPADAFYYNGGKSSLNGHPNQNGRLSPAHGRPGSTGNVAADLVRDMRAKDAELETLRRRETWMKAALSKATKAGFVWPDHQQHDNEDIDDLFGGLMSSPNSTSPDSSGDVRKLAEIAIKLKQERAMLQVR